MTKLSMVDFQILFLGIRNQGNFDESDIEKSDLKKLGVGRILDQLATLKDRKLIVMNEDKSFSITKTGRHILWDDKIPLWVRILRILEIKSQKIETIGLFLLENPDKITQEIEDLRKRNLVLMSPLRSEHGLQKFYEILPEGIEILENIRFGIYPKKPEIKDSQKEIVLILEEIIKEIKENKDISNEKQITIISKLTQIKEKLVTLH